YLGPDRQRYRHGEQYRGERDSTKRKQGAIRCAQQGVGIPRSSAPPHRDPSARLATFFVGHGQTSLETVNRCAASSFAPRSGRATGKEVTSGRDLPAPSEDQEGL